MSQAPLHSDSPVPILSYLSPHQFESGVWREGSVLVMQKQAVLPDACVKCGLPAERRISKTFYWHHPSIYLLIFFPGILIYAIVAMIIRKSVKVEIGLCAEHQSRRRRNMWISWGLFLIGAGSLGGGITWSLNAHGSDADNAPFVILAGIVLLITSALWAVFALRMLWPKKIDATHAWLNGACSAYLQSLPNAR